MKKIIFLLVVNFILSSSFNSVTASVIIPSNSGITKPDPAEVKAAIASFHNLSRHEKRDKIKQVKQEIKAFKAARKAGKEADTNTLLLVILAILLPPLAVYLFEGEIGNHFWISLILTLLFYLPGIIYALVLILGSK